MAIGLVIDGTRRRVFVNRKTTVRYQVWVNGKEYDLTFRIFKTLAILAARRVGAAGGGWILAPDLYQPQYLAYENIRGLRAAVPGVVIDDRGRSGGGGFRLRMNPEGIAFTLGMQGFDDGDIQREMRAAGVYSKLVAPHSAITREG